MQPQFLKDRHNDETKRLIKSFIPRGIIRVLNYQNHKKRFPTCFVSSESKVHKGVTLGKHCLIQESVIGANATIGDFTTLGHQGRIGGQGGVFIGKYCSIAPECLMWSENHNTNFKSAYPLEHMYKGKNTEWEEYIGEPIKIGHAVWIGQRVTILAGADIGTGCIIAAGAVVSRGVYPPFTIIGGVPAKVIKNRFDEPTVEKLMKAAWWDKSPETILNTLMLDLHTP